MADKFILLDEDVFNSQKSQLDYELVIDPVVTQDSETWQDTLKFAYPVEATERTVHTLRPFLRMTLKEVDDLVS